MALVPNGFGLKDSDKSNVYYFTGGALSGGDATLTLPADGGVQISDIFVLQDLAQELKNKTIDGSSGGTNTITIDASDIAGGILTVPRGGTGVSFVTSNTLLRGNGAGALAETSLTVDGSDIISGVGGLIAGGTSLGASALLQLDSTVKGFLPPRMTETQRDAIVTPVAGLVIYQTDVLSGIYVYDGAAWVTSGAGAFLPLAGGAMTGAITTNSTFDGRDVATDGAKLDSITDIGSGIIISSAERTKLGGIEALADVTDTANVSAAGALMTAGGAMTGAITTSSTFDGRDVATDGTKLDGIEALADVTDNANVAAAGALMTAGGAMTGAITTNSTFDGRDVATDGTKLDGIEALADVTDNANVAAAGALMTAGGAMTGDIAMGGTNQITGLGDPSLAQDAATKNYVDNLANGLDVKASVRLATIANVDNGTNGIVSGFTYNNIGGTSDSGQITAVLNAPDTFTMDGETLSASEDGTRILFKNQTDPKSNGIWVTTILGTALTLDRSEDFDGAPADEVTSGAFMFVEEGTANTGRGFVLVTPDTVTVGTVTGSDLDFSQFSQAGAYTAGSGIVLSSGVFSADRFLNGGIVFESGQELQVDVGASALIGTLAVGNGGTGLASYTAGDIIYASGATTFTKLPAGTGTQFLTGGVAPTWTTPAVVTPDAHYALQTTPVLINNASAVDVAYFFWDQSEYSDYSTENSMVTFYLTAAATTNVTVSLFNLTFNAGVGEEVGTTGLISATAGAKQFNFTTGATLPDADDVLVLRVIRNSGSNVPEIHGAQLILKP